MRSSVTVEIYHTVDTTFDNLTDITANTRVTVILYRSLVSIFPPNDADVSFTGRLTDRLTKNSATYPEYVISGVQPHQRRLSLYQNGSNIGWRVEVISHDHDDDPLLPDDYLIVRNANGAPRFL